MSLSEKLQTLSEQADSLSQEILHDERLLELLDEAKVRVNIETEHFAGNFDFGPEVTEWIRERARERLTGKLECARRRAHKLMER